ncbi:MAG: class I SAM-dependent methyltransferase [Anaerolineae bacterium]|nr:class I SAM-dependent methyltransferase [Anaerolineae bacterium]
MSETVAQCPLCKHTESALFDRREFRGQSVINQICKRCGLVFQSPRMNAAELDAFYEAEYRTLYQGGEGPSPKDLAVQQARAEALLAITAKYLPAVQRHLDIGCSAGLLLQRFQSALASQPVGVEPGESYRAYARAQGLEVHASLDELPAEQMGNIELVSMAHVLEHLPDPIAYLQDLREKILAPDGWLLLEVPNLYAHDSFEVAHMTAFSAHSLRQVLLQAGFEIVMLRKHGQPRSHWLPLYLTVLARPRQSAAPVSIQAESAVAVKRRVGMLHRRVLSRLSPRRAWISKTEIKR